MDAGIQTTKPEEIPFNSRGANSVRHFAYNNPGSALLLLLYVICFCKACARALILEESCRILGLNPAPNKTNGKAPIESKDLYYFQGGWDQILNM